MIEKDLYIDEVSVENIETLCLLRQDQLKITLEEIGDMFDDQEKQRPISVAHPDGTALAAILDSSTHTTLVESHDNIVIERHYEEETGILEVTTYEANKAPITTTADDSSEISLLLLRQAHLAAIRFKNAASHPEIDIED